VDRRLPASSAPFPSAASSTPPPIGTVPLGELWVVKSGCQRSPIGVWRLAIAVSTADIICR
jgi:hypothetical protein